MIYIRISRSCDHSVCCRCDYSQVHEQRPLVKPRTTLGVTAGFAMTPNPDSGSATTPTTIVDMDIGVAIVVTFTRLTTYRGLNSETQAKIEQRHPYREANDERDVVAMVKQFMADEELIQAPLLIIPTALWGNVTDFFHDLNKEGMLVDRMKIRQERRAELGKLAAFFTKYFGSVYNRAVEYMTKLQNKAGPKAPPILDFLKFGRRADLSRGLAHERRPQEAFVPHKLHVSFKRPRVLQ